MPNLFLSPSTQTFNPYITTGNEQYWMNMLADRMVPCLHINGINVTRNDPNANAAASIRQSNAGKYDFHLALHSNASPEARAGQNRGIELYYFPSSEDGLEMAEIITENLRPIYPLPDLVRPVPTTVIGEVRRTNAPSVLAELGYHDNTDDANWLTENLDAVAQALCRSVAEYFDIDPVTNVSREGVVSLQSGSLNLRDLPDTDSRVLTRIPNGTQVRILGQTDDWYTTAYNGIYGFVSAPYIRLL